MSLKAQDMVFDFNNAMDLVYAGKLSEIINKVTVV